MASYSVSKAKHATLSSTTVDTVTVAAATEVFVMNRGGTADLTVTSGATTPATPVALADDTDVVAPGTFIRVATAGAGGYPQTWIVKVLGDGNDYSVVGY